MTEAQEKLLKELNEYAYEVRLDWSDFDGRSLMRFVSDWTKRFREASK